MDDETVLGRLATLAGERGGHAAIEAGGESWTYSAFGRLTDQLAGALVDRGVRAGERVGLLFGRENHALAALCGVWKSGACAVPLLQSDPLERLHLAVADADVTCVIAGESASDLAGRLEARVVGIDSLLASTAPVPAAAIDPEAHAVLLYTSGSTGRPKGVPLSHRMLAHRATRLQDALRIDARDRVTLFSSVGAGQGLIAIALIWMAGATACPFDIKRDGLSPLVADLAAGRVTAWISSATLLRNTLRSVEQSVFSGVHLVRLGGERVDAADLVAARRAFPAARLVVTYATTETGGIAAYEVPAGTAPSAVVPVGPPLRDMTVSVLDEDSRPCGPLESGEIAVAGMIAEGYWRDPELTAARFIADPRSGARWYRTGDIGRWNGAGELEVVGRTDLRVKIRGYRVEIEEIETVLNQQADVVVGAVAARPGHDGDSRLVAYVQAVPDSGLTVERLRAQLATRLPDYMLPSAVVFLDALPVTAAGKVARQELPDPEPQDRPALASTFVAPRTALEATVAAVWCEVLGLPSVGIHDEFLSLGGDSLKATLVASRLAARIGREVPLSALFDAGTIAELSAAIAAGGST